MSELDLSGLEEEIEGIDEVAHRDYYQYVTQLYVYVRVDEKYRTLRNHLQLIRLGEKYMTLLHNAMISVQMKKTGVGIFTCFYQDKAITENLVTYFLMQKEVDFLEVGFDRRYPGEHSLVFPVQREGPRPLLTLTGGSSRWGNPTRSYRVLKEALTNRW
ncbi:hypothetical protein PCYB_084030 [Plasmodium cynomolgi strain B]|uniref:Uncharacterized protein n=1 Tax=Plasmodium cynomolgi (strain B) TaxID=1120755 RepID=K6VAM3_PLACD|nr:hypothetical protein PCYB_084030 [Plasmodium cynomolgi strain B]GAB66242.1 hypothetical protein PCYB_084030 [Plasmodium cynomolgi strain B]